MASDLPLTEMILAVGALGTAAYGTVEGFKYSPTFAAAGFEQLKKSLGAPLFQALKHAYGTDFEAFLKAQYIDGRTKGDLPRSLRQGVRLALNPDNAEALATMLGHLDGTDLKQAATKTLSGEQVNDAERGILARFEIAVDARIDAALALAQNSYKGIMQLRASLVAVVLAIAGSIAVHVEETEMGLVHTFNFEDLVIALIVGVAAVPLAPIAKDVSSAIQSAQKISKGRP